MAVGQNQWFHVGVAAPPILVFFSGDGDVHWGYPWPDETESPKDWTAPLPLGQRQSRTEPRAAFILGCFLKRTARLSRFDFERYPRRAQDPTLAAYFAASGPGNGEHGRMGGLA